jgi:hypothetical protein
MRLTPLILILFLTSCTAFIEPMPKSWNWGLKPRPANGVRGFPSVDTDYGKGFRDGCTSAWDAVTKGLPSDLKPKFDYKRYSKSSDYSTGWGDGFEHCTTINDWDVF